MRLHIETAGSGEPLVLLHGWGMHGGIWHETAEQLAQRFQVHCVDLPGHGFSAGQLDKDGSFTLDAVVTLLATSFGAPLNVLGWSLGGILAQEWARRAPHQVQRLVLVASTPCFSQRSEWRDAMPQEILAQFAAALEHEFADTLRRFLALQVRGSAGERELLASLRERLFSRGEPEMAALRGGLDILRDVDLREVLPSIQQPVLVMAGERDRLTPPQASRYLAERLPCAQLVEFTGAAHAPFLSHRDEFVRAVGDFLVGMPSV